MAFTNAEKQARHRERVKGRLALAAVVEQFRAILAVQIAEEGGDPSSFAVVAEHVFRLMHTPEGAETIRPFLAQAIGVPALPMGMVE